jgi:hypothetical protein
MGIGLPTTVNLFEALAEGPPLLLTVWPVKTTVVEVPPEDISVAPNDNADSRRIVPAFRWSLYPGLTARCCSGGPYGATAVDTRYQPASCAMAPDHRTTLIMMLIMIVLLRVRHGRRVVNKVIPSHCRTGLTRMEFACLAV